MGEANLGRLEEILRERAPCSGWWPGSLSGEFGQERGDGQEGRLGMERGQHEGR